jgi:hypothetical protein
LGSASKVAQVVVERDSPPASDLVVDLAIQFRQASIELIHREAGRHGLQLAQISAPRCVLGGAFGISEHEIRRTRDGDNDAGDEHAMRHVLDTLHDRDAAGDQRRESAKCARALEQSFLQTLEPNLVVEIKQRFAFVAGVPFPQ